MYDDQWRLEGFEEIRELGSGAQGRVVLARHTESGTPVAIKYLARGEGDDEAVERLRQEALMLAKVTDPHVVRLYRFAAGERGAALVMEAIDGVSLKELLARHGAMPPEAALAVLKGSLLGLAAAHAVGVVHRDYKPANVVVQGDGLSKLIDFGIAALTGVGSREGSPAYMAPEQWRGEPATPATDVYSATCVFFECVTGAKPYSAPDPMLLMHRHLNDPIPVEAVPEALRPLLERGMAKDGTRRPAGAAAFVAELESVASAAYGPDWEQRGVRVLATGAVALAAMFPLGAALAPAASGAAGAMGAGTAAAGTSAAGAASAGAAGTGLLATAGAKITMAVAGTALAVGAGTTVAAVTGGEDEPPAPVVQNVAFSTPLLGDRTIEVAGGRRLLVRGMRYAQITGHTDAALQERINAALRAPLDTAVEAAQRVVRQDPQMGRPGIQCDGAQISARAVPGLRTGRLISVRYELRAGWVCNSDFVSDWAITVTVALDSGKALAAADVFTPATLTPAGLGTLWSRVPKPAPEPNPAGAPCTPPARITPADLRPAAQGVNDAPVDIGFTAQGMTVSVQPAGGDFCTFMTLTVPYDRVRDLMLPRFAELLPR
ncbi:MULTISPECIES: serine/threonine-protein kinase [Thermomonospora]|uniref:non-specific serine/threonine protein kinase n=1 Tax=Thermomonospora cellulosilytica TaxID=1411118 RepID=A0A7W3MXX4_9ACTN|nr:MULTISPECIES: serine/threonine-protein kinase [Thermomonospora]MBA9003891.1 serine/threonine-protein kinase [Thermomonospora cellulosilytica]